MAAPEFVPDKPLANVRSYTSPPRRPEPWLPLRPGDLDRGQPRGNRYGNQGPDQGYVLVLARRFSDKLILEQDEHSDDAITGGSVVALKRASLFGRAPVVHDLTVALTVWGFLDQSPPADLVDVRRRLFREVANPHHYEEQRRIADAVPESTLRMTPAQVSLAHRNNWRSLVNLDEIALPAP